VQVRPSRTRSIGIEDLVPASDDIVVDVPSTITGRLFNYFKRKRKVEFCEKIESSHYVFSLSEDEFKSFQQSGLPYAAYVVHPITERQTNEWWFRRIEFKNDLLCTVKIEYVRSVTSPRILWTTIEPGGIYVFPGREIWKRAFEFLEFTMLNLENCGVFTESLKDQRITAITNNGTDVRLSLSEILSKEFKDNARQFAIRNAK